MNDIEKAIEILSQDICYIGDRFTRDEYDKAVQIVMAALEKQIPKKPIEIKERHNFSQEVIYKDGCCPVCKSAISSTYTYCNKCGQRIDWGEENE